MPMTARNVCGGLALCLIASAASAQPPAEENPRQAVRRAFEESGLRAGSPFPDLSIYRADGKSFQTKDLRGNYAVLVTGCLT